MLENVPSRVVTAASTATSTLIFLIFARKKDVIANGIGVFFIFSQPHIASSRIVNLCQRPRSARRRFSTSTRPLVLVVERLRLLRIHTPGGLRLRDVARQRV